MTWPIHGSNPQYLYKAFEMKIPEQYIDFSANINPLGPPRVLRADWGSFLQEISDYPDPNASELTGKLAEQLLIPSSWIMVGNGAAELIALIGRMLLKKKALIIQPAFSEYEWACTVNECEVIYHTLVAPNWKLDVEEIGDKLKDVDAVFLCSPSNPTGINYPQEDIIRMMELCKEQGCLFILDEAFYDYLLEYQSILPYLKDFPNVIILRSLTKMFAIPGLRLGYLIAQPSIIENLLAFKPHWSVNSIALRAGQICIQDQSYINETKEYIDKERTKLSSFFEQEGFCFSASQVNFYLLKDPQLEDQLPLFTFLLEKGIVPRHTMNFPGLEGAWMRFAIKGSIENNQLMTVLKEWRNSKC